MSAFDVWYSIALVLLGSCIGLWIGYRQWGLLARYANQRIQIMALGCRAQVKEKTAGAHRALRLAAGAMAQTQPCMDPQCHQEQREFIDTAAAAIERYLEAADEDIAEALRTNEPEKINEHPTTQREQT